MKNPFSDGDTTVVETVETVQETGSVIISQKKLMDINHHKAEICEIFKADTLYDIDLIDSVYSFGAHPAVVSNSLADFRKDVSGIVESNLPTVTLHADTFINGETCYVFFINIYDAIENGHHNFTHWSWYIDKQNLLPVYVKRSGEGEAEKDGHSLGRLHFFTETFFFDVKQDSVMQGMFSFDKSAFDLQNTTMLAPGEQAPVLTVRDLNDVILSADELKNKVLFIEFGATDCAANPLANPMLNRLYKRYSTENFAIVSIYANETPGQLIKYITTNNIQFPVYIGSTKLRRRFQTKGTPNFYLLDKKGIIILAFDGYRDDLEHQVTSEVDSLLQYR